MSLSTFQSLIDQFGRVVGLSNLSIDDSGYCSLEVDSTLIFQLQYVETNNSVYIFSEIGTLVGQHAPQIAMQLLAANLFGIETGGGTLALQADSSTVVFSYQISLENLEFARFQGILENVMNYGERWQNRLGELVRNQGTEDSPAPFGAPAGGAKIETPSGVPFTMLRI